MDKDAFLLANVGAALRLLATQVENGNVIKLNFNWDGGADIQTTMTMQKPMEFVTVNMSPLDTKK